MEMAIKGAMAHGRMRDDVKMCVLRITTSGDGYNGWVGRSSGALGDGLLSRGVCRGN